MPGKVKAFTIVELVVAMLISSVVISMLFYVFTLFNKQFIRYQEKSNQVNEYFLFQKAFTTDIREATSLQSPAPQMLRCIHQHSRRIFEYNFLDSLIVRTEGEHIEKFLLKNKITEMGHVEKDKDQSPVNQVRVQIILDRDQLDLVFTKQYSAEQLINLIDIHE